MRAFGSLPQDKEETLGWIKKERERIEKLKKSRIKHENVEMVLKKISKEEEKAKIKIMSNEFEQRVSLSEEAKDENKIICTKNSKLCNLGCILVIAFCCFCSRLS